MPTKAGKPTRKEKSEANKAEWRELTQEARELLKADRAAIIRGLREDDSLGWKDKFLEAIKAGLMISESATAARQSLTTVYREFSNDEEFNKNYTHAREISNDIKAERLQEMQNEPPREIHDQQGNKIYDKTDLAWRAAKESTAKWLLSIRDPKKFGNNSRLQAELTGKDGSALGQTIVVTQKELNEAKARLEEESR